ncbi:MAG: FHA domain-containing protein [Armatimonadota bacterium]
MLTALVCGATSGAQKLQVEKKGTYLYWFEYTDVLGNEKVTQPVKFKGQSVDLDTSALGTAFKKARILVMNKKTGNLAILDYTAPKHVKAAKPVEVKEESFTYVRAVRLRVVSEDGSPLESGLVEITDGEGTPMTAVLTPPDAGVAAFWNVASGEINVKVRAKGVSKTVDSDIELPTKRKLPWFERDVRVKGDVDTLPAAKTAERARPAPAEPARVGGINSLLQMVAGLVFVIVVVAITYAVIKSKGVTAEQALRKLGVQLPGDQGEPGGTPGVVPAAAVDPNVCPFCGQRKDASGNCACAITAGAAPGVAVTSAGVPRLVGIAGTYMGQIFEIGWGSKVIGREAGCDIALTSDSTTSRRHATITASAGVYSIRDEGSANGTFVNGARITEQKLTPGDEIQIGATRFRFEV